MVNQEDFEDEDFATVFLKEGKEAKVRWSEIETFVEQNYKSIEARHIPTFRKRRVELTTNELFTLVNLEGITLVQTYLNNLCCLVILDEAECTVDQFYLMYDETLVDNIKEILSDNDYEDSRFYLLLSY